MPHRTVPSFTVEIRRARKPSVHALTRKVAAPNWDAHHRPKRLPFDDLFAATKPSRLSLGVEATHDGSQASVGRLLPSLASTNSLQVREQQETREEPARQRRARKVSGRVETSGAPDSVTASGEALASSLTKAESVPPTPAMQEAHVTTSSPADIPSADMEQRRNTKGKDYRTAYRKAVRRDLPLPLLPAGERWKRRLPPICR